MKLLLKEFQAEAVDELVSEMRHAAAEAAHRNKRQAVSLASPTGSGKTIIATAAIERILDGDADHPPERNAVFLWISDQPEINEQTRRKMLEASSTLGPSRLSVIDSSFDQGQLTPGRLYFLNTQKLGKDRTLVTLGDERRHTIWDTITRTAEATPDHFYFFVFIDEAHRGMIEDAKDQEQAATIIQKFIKGSPGELPPVPLVVGVSATPARFQQLVAGSRTIRPVLVPVERVRTSGLLKETITLYHPTETQPSDITMLRAAARTWREFTDHWADYCQAQDEPLVVPILVVQVEDATDKQISKTNIPEAIAAVNDEVGPLPDEAFAHAFQEGAARRLGEHDVRYLAPASIDGDADVRVVFFKTGLNTGWDCPRAEVMMSFRRAVDSTLIAQLVGRMVRTPLARRVDSDEFLNTVALYLPHFDTGGLDRVVANLTAPDHELVPPVDVERGEDVVVCSRNPALAECFEALQAVPTYVLPAPVRTNQVRRYLRLARLLEQDGLEPDASEAARTLLLSTLRTEYESVKDREDFKTGISEKAELNIRGIRLDYATGDRSEAAGTLATSAENVDDMFDWAGRKLTEGLHKDFWRSRVLGDRADPAAAKLEIFHLASDPQVLDRIEKTARQRVSDLLRTHEAAIQRLPEGRKQEYADVRRRAGQPECARLSYPEIIEVRAAKDRRPRHLYVDDDGHFPCVLNTWEAKVIGQALDDPNVVGWLRNLDRKPWSLCVPYEFEGEARGLYPDFLVFRRDGDDLTIDIVDPHSVSLEDAPAKALGLAKYAANHGHAFGHIHMIVVDDDRVQRLDLNDEVIRDRVKAVVSQGHLRLLFELA